ncbi:MAG: class C sortase [Clostridiales bacterium]|nr:class C sortase [Clostridiales bacterium]
MKKGTVNFIIILLLLAGAALFLYPVFSSYLAELHQAEVVMEYDASVQEMQEEELAKEWKKAEEYNESLAGEPVRDPFLEGSGMALPQNYLEILRIFDTMGTVEIPKIGVSLPIYHGTDAETLEKGVGHLRQTALPIGGEGIHAVLTGHTGLPNAKMFDGLTKLEIGDKFYIHVLGETLAYEVDALNVVKPEEVELLDPVPGEDHVTLLTCTPYGVNTHRLLVRGIRVPYVEEERIQQQEQQEGLSLRQQLVLQVSIVGGAIAVVLMIMLIFGIRSKKQRSAASEK